MKKISLGILFLLLLAVFLGGTGFVIVNYTNNKTYEGEVTAHYKDKTRSNTYYYELDNKTVLKNSTLLFKTTSKTVRIQEKVEIGQRIRVDTVGIRIPILDTYPIVYQLEVLNEWICSHLLYR